jgi:ABC-2 type transport system permease protein
MNKVWLIIRREYFTRVRNKTFILSTILLPLFFIGFIATSAYLSIKSVDKHTIAVKDNNGIFKNSFHSDEVIKYEFPDDVNAGNFKDKGYSGILIIPKNYESGGDSITLLSEKQLGMVAEDRVKDQINSAIRNKAFLDKKIDKKILDSINNIDEEKLYKFSPVVKKGNKTLQSNSGLAYGIGFGSGILIYITLFIYGAAVMRGVMEEKMNRIAEVIISSVRPFQLMMGKIIGIAAVGLTQFLIWIVLIVGLSSLISLFLGHDVVQQAQTVNTQVGSSANSSVALGF